MWEPEDVVDTMTAWNLAMEAHREIEQIVSSLGRSLDLMACENDLKGVIAQEGLIDTQTQQLLDIIRSMAVAGTPIAPERIMPSCESYRHLAVALEDQTPERLQNIGATFNDLFSKIGTWFSHVSMMFKSIDGRIKTVRSKADELHTLGFTTLPSIQLADRSIFMPESFNLHEIPQRDNHITEIKHLTENFKDVQSFLDNFLNALQHNSTSIY